MNRIDRMIEFIFYEFKRVIQYYFSICTGLLLDLLETDDIVRTLIFLLRGRSIII